jgi:hypothetical protein
MICEEVVRASFGGLEEIDESLVTFLRDLHDFQVKRVRMLSDFFQEPPENAETFGSMC